jgi:uncharacterized protein
MPRYFFDTSALIKLYHQEDGTETVDQLVEKDQPTIVVSDLTVVEMVSALAKKVRTQEITAETFHTAVAAFEQDVTAFENHATTPTIMLAARQLLKKRGLSHGLRTLDALQIAAALSAHKWEVLDLFIASDRRLTTVAKQESLPTLLV